MKLNLQVGFRKMSDSELSETIKELTQKNILNGNEELCLKEAKKEAVKRAIQKARERAGAFLKGYVYP